MDTHDTALDDGKAKSDKLKAVFDRAIKRFQDTAEPQLEMRELALSARRFVTIPGAQWEGIWGEQFENTPRVEVPKILRGIRKIETDYRDNRIAPDFRPSGGESDQETADTLDGLHRADSYQFKAQQARDNAFSEAVRGGFGAYRLTNEWADPYDKDSDEQRINPGMVIVDADQRVFFDLNSKLYDKSDARFAFVITSFTRDAFEEQYPDAACSSWDDYSYFGRYEWASPDMVRVAEYYEREEVSERLYVLTHTLVGQEERFWHSDITDEEIEERQAQGWTVTERRKKRVRIHKYIISGTELLSDQGRIAGPHIPIVPVYGARDFVDDQERFTGYVQPRMDAQRLYNAKVSKLAEVDTLAPRETPIFATEQMTPNLAAQWATANISRLPYLLVNPLRNEDGSIAVAGEIGKVMPPQLPPVTAGLLQIANNDLTEDDQDGASEIRANTSADAMDIAATRVDAKSGVFLDNMRQSVQREGEIYLGMAGEVYVEPGRIVETMDEDGGDGTAVLMQAATGKNGNFHIRNDFTRGRYKVIASVSEATATRRDKTVKRCLQAAQIAISAQDMEGAQAFIGTAMLNSDGEGMQDLQQWYRQRMVSMGVVPPNEDEKAAMEQAAQNEQPDPTVEMVGAQTEALRADAEETMAKARKTDADTGLAQAKTIETLASAEEKGAKAAMASIEAMPRIRFGYEGQGMVQ